MDPLVHQNAWRGLRSACAYASLDDKWHFLFGGQDANGYTVVEYKSTLQSFRTHPSLPEKRYWSAATAIDDDLLLVVGGSSSSTEKSCCVYDPRSKEWSNRRFVYCVLMVIRVSCTNSTRTTSSQASWRGPVSAESSDSTSSLLKRSDTEIDEAQRRKRIERESVCVLVGGTIGVSGPDENVKRNNDSF